MSNTNVYTYTEKKFSEDQIFEKLISVVGGGGGGDGEIGISIETLSINLLINIQYNLIYPFLMYDNSCIRSR